MLIRTLDGSRRIERQRRANFDFGENQERVIDVTVKLLHFN